MKITIGGTEYGVEEVRTEHYRIPLLELDDGTEWYVATSHEAAGLEARKYWKDMAENDSSEFTCMVGENNLVAWALGQWAGPGSTKVQTLEEWLDLYLDVPEEHFASYDFVEWDVDSMSSELLEELEWDDPTTDAVAYRCN